MTVAPGEPGVDGLGEVVGVLREWQSDAAPAHLHPRDLGWFWRFGAAATAAAVRTWSRDGRVLAVVLDGPTLPRPAIAPGAPCDEELARRAALLEPMGVHRDHRGRGHGRAMGVAAARALRELGASSALVRTPSANVAAVATHRAGGFHRLPETRDLNRDA
ncbi:GNAT family N-acetyltransferase [Streptomyces maremycinicus]|uniref:GNAT family N-acetyltransferase n=1 Tax=Streptomyces maremycinicus TaxID=1679753 RepID=UPI000787E571|nr:GNAT family N-acetyltransferase [Streptomyces sp. NBRC 110468]